MPPRLFKNVGFSAIVAVACVGVRIYYSFTVLWPTMIGSLYISLLNNKLASAIPAMVGPAALHAGRCCPSCWRTWRRAPVWPRWQA